MNTQRGTTASQTILWLENDIAWISTYVEELRESGFEVTVERSPLDAEALLEKRRFDLLILDVMIPTSRPGEEDVYDPDATEQGTSTGLLFYRRQKERLKVAGTRVLVMTVRLDEAVRDAFVAEGLHPSCFTNRLTVRRLPDFLDRLGKVLGSPTE